jgi:hypothetical protein
MVFREDFTSWRHIADNGGIGTDIVLRSSGAASTNGAANAVLSYAGRGSILQGASAMTILATLLVRTLPGQGFVVAKLPRASATNYQFAFSFNSSLSTLYLPTTITDGATYAQAVPGLTAGKLYRIAWVYNGAGTGNAGRVQLYYDGVAQSIGFNGTIPATMTQSRGPIELMGTVSFPRSFPADFELRQVRIYNRALSASDILEDYRS